MESTKKNLFLLDINQFWQPLEESSFLQMQEHSCTSRQVQQSNPTDQNPLPTPAKHDSPAAANSSEAESVVIGRRNLSNQENTREARTAEAALKEVDVPLTGQPSSSNESSSPIVQAQSVDHHAFRPLRSVVPTPEVHEKGETEKDLQEFLTMAVEQMALHKIQFGKAKLGMTFEKAFNDLAWTKFVTSKYGDSDKKEHRMFVTYAQLRTEQEIQALDLDQWKSECVEPPVPVKAPPMTAVKSKACPSMKASQQGYASSSRHSQSDPANEINILQGRMDQMGTLQEVVLHLRNLTVSAQQWTLVKEALDH